jgi:hypothetical protein
VTREQTAFALFVLLIGIFGVAGAVVTMEPGWIVAAEQDDRQRVEDLDEIAIAVMQFKAIQKTLPYDVSKIVEAQPAERPLHVDDPETKRPYEYSRIDEKSYRLCADFALESAPWNSGAPVTRLLPAPADRSGARVIVSRNSPPATFQFVPRAYPPLSGISAASWKHPAGEHCFDFDDRSSAPIEEAVDRETKT